MLRKPSPWLVRRVPNWLRRARRARSAVLSAVAHLQLGQVVFDSGALTDSLVEIAGSRWLNAASLREVVRENVAAHGPDAVASATRLALDRLAGDPRAVTRLADAAARGLVELGAIEDPLELLARAGGSRALRERLSRQSRLLANGVSLSPRSDRGVGASERILYYAAQSLPHHGAGYSIRTHWLVRNLRERGWDVSVHTRFGYPNDRYDFIGVNVVDRRSEVDGVRYEFAPAKRGYLSLDIESYQSLAAGELTNRASAVRPAVIHCASNYSVGLAGVEAARRLGIPSVYEVRGLWHMTRAANQPEYDGSDHYRMLEGLEATAAAGADRVLVITDAIGEVLRQRGVAADKIVVVPNAIDPEQFAVSERDEALARSLGIDGATVIGYIGTFKHYEGLDDLLRAVARLRDRPQRFRLLLVGDGEVLHDLVELCRQLGLNDIVVFVGRQPHARIPAFYSLVDIMAFPRRGLPLCEVVSPLKPFEAMATGATVVASDVRALREIVEDEQTGLICRADDADDLADKLGRLLAAPELRHRLAERARDWVSEHRTWTTVCDRIDRVYRELGAEI